MGARILEVVFLGDLDRGAQVENIRATYHLFSPVFQSLDVPTQVYFSSRNQKRCVNEWLDDWKSSLVSGTVHPKVRDLDPKSTAVFGFEMSEAMTAALNANGVKWVNACIHPIRFGRDLHFHFEASFDTEFQRYAVPETALFLYANLIKLKGSRHQRKPIDSGRTLLIVGQVPDDRSVFFDGKFMSLLDYEERLRSITSSFDRVLYRPHVNRSDPNLDKQVCDLTNAELAIDLNFYDLLAMERIDACCAISSSTVHEAPYFGVEGIFLEQRARRFGVPIEFGNLLADQQFWSVDFLGKHLPKPRDDEHVTQTPDNLLRYYYDSWGYMHTAPSELVASAINKRANSRTSWLERKMKRFGRLGKKV